MAWRSLLLLRGWLVCNMRTKVTYLVGYPHKHGFIGWHVVLKGGVFEGEWFADKCHGFGVFDYPNGDHFEGLWVDGLKEGLGVHFYFDREKRTHTKRYDGEWIDGTPKCGAYTEMPPDALVPESQTPDPLPASGLVDPNGVLAARLREIREARALHRAKRVPLDEHFTAEELEALQLAFERVAEGGSTISVAQLPAAFTQVGMEVGDDDVAAILCQLGKEEEGDAATFAFAEFAQAADFLSPIDDEQ